MSTRMTGAQAMVKCLELENIGVIFGYPGAAICPFYDSLYSSHIRHILTRNEQNAGHAASGYARVTGKPSVCVATSGPGATNLITAMATAYVDSIPLVVITGQVSSDLLGRDVFQEVDITGAAEPFTKYSYLVKDAKDLPRVFKEAFYIASTGRKGPVLIDVPVDIQRQEIEFSYPKQVDIRGYKPTYKGHIMQVKRVAQAIKNAKRPLLCIGGGVFAAGAQKAVRSFSEEFSIPVVSTLMGIGAMPTAHPLYFGMLGNNGKKYANQAVQESDLLIIMGARVGDRAVSRPALLEHTTSIIHIDIDPAEIGKNLGTTIPLVGDVGQVLEQLTQQNPQGEYTQWLAQLEEWRLQEQTKQKEELFPREETKFINPREFFNQLSFALEEDAVFVSDVGQNQMWSATSMVIKEGRFLTTGGMGTMGYALPAAIGAKLAAPDRQVIASCGDGAFQMSMMELATVNQHQIPIKLIVMNNHCLGMVREVQTVSYHDRQIAVDLAGGPQIEKIAKAYDIPFLRLEDARKMEGAIKEFIAADGSFLLECMVDPRETTVAEGEDVVGGRI